VETVVAGRPSRAARVLERFRVDHGDKPLDSLEAIHIKALMDKIDGGPHPKRN
jgi:hypothetical protein